MLCLQNQRLHKNHFSERVTGKVSTFLGLHLQDGLLIENSFSCFFLSALNLQRMQSLECLECRHQSKCFSFRLIGFQVRVPPCTINRFRCISPNLQVSGLVPWVKYFKKLLSFRTSENKILAQDFFTWILTSAGETRLWQVEICHFCSTLSLQASCPVPVCLPIEVSMCITLHQTHICITQIL